MRTENAKAKRLANWKKFKLVFAEFMKVYPFTLESLDGENWLDVNFCTDYKISSYGRIKSFKQGKEKIIAPVISMSGYLKVRLNIGGKRKTFSIHRLVLTHFVPNPDNLPQINHIDGNKFNNCVDNLEWCTAAENTKHADENNLRHFPKGEDAYQATATNEQARYIREQYLSGRKTQAELAEETGLSIRAIGKICRGQTYKSATVEVPKVKICAQCGKEFHFTKPSQKYCSRKCASKNLVRQKETRTCVICGKSFECRKYTPTQTCSYECTVKLREINHPVKNPSAKRRTYTKETRTCAICGKSFQCRKSSATKTCSRECATKYQSSLT